LFWDANLAFYMIFKDPKITLDIFTIKSTIL